VGISHCLSVMWPNETELSHRWRERALLRILMLKSCKIYSLERPAVGWSCWLGDFVVIRLFSAVLFSAIATPTVEIADVVVTVLWAEEGGRTLKTE